MSVTSESGKLIVVEGIDGTGKSTQVSMLASFLKNSGLQVLQSLEPSNGPHGKKLRRYMMESAKLSAEEELQMFLDDREQHVREVIRPALSSGKDVVLDRYYFSTLAYQGARGFDKEELRKKNLEIAPKPDILIILDIDVETALKRIKSRGEGVSVFEKRELLVFCRQTFLEEKNQDYTSVIDANASIEDVHKAICEKVMNRKMLK